MNTPLRNDENVARAIFSPLMVDDEGRISRGAFVLRHKENYISVSRMSVATWMDDVLSMPQNENRRLFGYAMLNAGETRRFKARPYGCCD